MSAAEIIRASGIGASDIAAVCGMGKFNDEWGVYAQKNGLVGPIEETERMFWGKKLEPVIAEVFGERMNMPIQWFNQRIESKRYAFMFASPDAFILSLDRTVRQGVLECKTAGLDQAGEWSKDDGDQDGVPEYYQAQVQWQLSTCELRLAYVAVLIAGNDFRVYEIHHDPDFEDLLVEEADYFWRTYIMAKREPPISGSDRARDYLRRRHPRDNGVIRRANLMETDLLNAYSELRALMDQATARRKELENQITQQIGDDAGLEWDGGKFTWKRIKDSKQVQWKILAEDQFLLSLPATEQKELVQRYTKIKPGYRRINFRDEDEE